MRSTPLKSGTLRRWLGIIAWLAVAWPACALGQLAPLKQLVESPAEVLTPTESPAATREKIEQWLSEAREMQLRVEAEGAAAALPAGIRAEDLEDRRRDLEQLVLTCARSLKNLSAVDNARKELEASQAKDAAWTGFEEPPPYPLPMVDELLNERDAIRSRLASLESTLTNSQSLLAGTMTDLKAAEEDVRGMITASQSAVGPERDAANWRMEAARTRSRLFAERAGFMQSRCESLEHQIAAATTDLALVERKVKIAKAKARFNDDDLAKIAQAAEARKQAITREIAEVSKRLKAAVIGHSQAQGALDGLLADSPGTDQAALDLAKYRLVVAEERVGAMQMLMEGLEYLIQLENISLTANQNRRAILKAATPQERSKALESLGNLRERLWAWENVVDDEIADTSVALGKLETPPPAVAPADPRLKLLADQREAASEKLAMLQRLSKAVVYQRKLVKRWDIEYAPPVVEAGFTEQIATLATSGWDFVKKIWSFEVMSFEDKVVVEGRTIIGKIPITLGTLLRAFLFFLVGYWLAATVANRIESSMVTRGHVADAQARTLRNWGMIVVGVFLAIATLSFLKIPLTVFAFFGGALAIGLGFGMQTLIKNFISGIIVLVERKVRVGDVLDVDGIIGTVTEINTRSSIIRSPDEVETLIPNSLFLENRVTNWTLSSRKMRRHLSVGVAYGSPPSKVMEILTDCAARHGLVCKDPTAYALLDDFADSALKFSLYYWLELKGSTNGLIVASDLRLMIEKRFAEAGVAVPFPQLDLHLSANSPLQVQCASAPGETPATTPAPSEQPG